MALFQLYAPDPEVRDLYADNVNYASDSGLNLFFPETLELKKGTTTLVDLKVSGAFFDGGRRRAFFMIPRSSIYKSRVRMANSVGLVDSLYSGTLKTALDALDDYTIQKGTSLFQICLPTLEPFPTIVLSEKQETTAERGEGGFGSTDGRVAAMLK